MNLLYVICFVVALALVVDQASACDLGYHNETESCVPCRAGYFCDGFNETACPKGQYSFAASESCLICPAGTYNPKEGAALCTLCQRGTFGTLTNAISVEYCDPCPNDQYSDSGAQFCIDCPVPDIHNTYPDPILPENEFLYDQCGLCPEGTFQLSNLTCQTCHQYDNITRTCYPCPYVPGNICPLNHATSVPCPAGRYNTDPKMLFCPECADGTWSPAGSAYCLGCDPGTYIQSKNQECQPCPPGRFCPNFNMTNYNTCVSGSYSLGGQVACIDCQAGRFSPSTTEECRDCPAGYQCPGEKRTNYIICPEGTWSDVGAFNCIPCEAGTFTDRSDTPCMTCPNRTISGDRASICTECGPGFISNLNNTACLACTGDTRQIENECVPCQRQAINNICCIEDDERNLCKDLLNAVNSGSALTVSAYVLVSAVIFLFF